MEPKQINYKKIKTNIADHYKVSTKFGYKLIDIENFGLTYNGEKIKMLEIERSGKDVFLTFRGYNDNIKEFDDKYSLIRNMFPVFYISPKTENKKIIEAWEVIKAKIE